MESERLVQSHYKFIMFHLIGYACPTYFHFQRMAITNVSGTPAYPWERTNLRYSVTGRSTIHNRVTNVYDVDFFNCGKWKNVVITYEAIHSCNVLVVDGFAMCCQMKQTSIEILRN